MPVTPLTQLLEDPIGERTIATLKIADVRVPDGAGGKRFATAAELVGTTLTLLDTASGSILNGVNAADLFPNHGNYTEATGVLLVHLVAADNVVLNPALAMERHLALVHKPGLLWVEIIFFVQDQSTIA